MSALSGILPVDVHADIILRGVEEGSITRDRAVVLAAREGGETLYAVRRRLDALSAFKLGTIQPMTPADAAVEVGYDAGDEQHVPTPDFFQILKGLAALRVRSNPDPEQRQRELEMLRQRIRQLEEAW